MTKDHFLISDFLKDNELKLGCDLIETERYVCDKI